MMCSLTHGSPDSQDLDRVYFFDALPELRACHRFCAEGEDNRNIAVVRDGIVVACFKGLPDEVNNGVLATYAHHPQTHPCPITRRVPRNVPLKMARAIRLMLTRLTRTPHRQAVKAALRSYDLRVTRQTLASLTLADCEVSRDVRKSLAFQLGQVCGLLDGVELYTKGEISQQYSELAPILARDEAAPLDPLDAYRDAMLAPLAEVEVAVSGTLNTLRVAETREDPFLVACQGMVLDLKAERAAMPPP